MQFFTPGVASTESTDTVSVEDPLPGIPKTLSVNEQESILQECGLDIHGMLDLEQIFPHLYSHNLLTDSEQELLQTSSVLCSRKSKISRLVTSLPRKGPDALWRFVRCLSDSVDGTGHYDLAVKIKKDCTQILRCQSKQAQLPQGEVHEEGVHVLRGPNSITSIISRWPFSDQQPWI